MEVYKIENGKINTRALEVHIVNHCNLRCDHCCSYSPFLKKWEITPDLVYRDLSKLKNYIKPSFLKIVGGEPTLHSNLLEVLRVARSSEISSTISLTTNGHFFDRISDECLELLDWITISVYPERNYSNDDLKKFIRHAKKFNVKINSKIQDNFVQMNREIVSSSAETKTVFKDCWIHHSCHSVRDGHFYSCTRTQYLKSMSAENFEGDSIYIHDRNEKNMVTKLRDYLNREEPLKTCYLCKGGQEHTRVQRQLNTSEVQEKTKLINEQCKKVN